MAFHTLALYLVAALVVTLAPGPDIITVITRSISQGVWAGLVATLGFASGLIFHTTAAVGLSILIQASPVALRTIQCLGAAYLVYLAIRMLMSKEIVVIEERQYEKGVLWRIYAQSVLMNVLNPKVWFFFVMFLWGFVDKQSAMPPWLQLVILGALFAACTLLCFGTCSVVAGRLTRFIRGHPQASRPLRWLTAVIFIGIAVQLVLWSPATAIKSPG